MLNAEGDRVQRSTREKDVNSITKHSIPRSCFGWESHGGNQALRSRLKMDNEQKIKGLMKIS